MGEVTSLPIYTCQHKYMHSKGSGILSMLNVEGHIFLGMSKRTEIIPWLTSIYVGGVPDLGQMTGGIYSSNFIGCLAKLSLNGCFSC